MGVMIPTLPLMIVVMMLIAGAVVIEVLILNTTVPRVTITITPSTFMMAMAPVTLGPASMMMVVVTAHQVLGLMMKMGMTATCGRQRGRTTLTQINAHR